MHTNSVKLKIPSKFPFVTFPVMGMLRVMKERYPQKLNEMINKCLHEIWHVGHHELDREALEKILQPTFTAEEISTLLNTAFSKETRRLLAQEAEALVDQGAFGFPWIVATRESDRASVAACVERTNERFGVEQVERIAAFLHEPYLGPMASGVTPRL